MQTANRTPKQQAERDAAIDAAVIAEMLETVEDVLTAPDADLTPNEKREALSRVVQDIYPLTDEDGFAVSLKSSLDCNLTIQSIKLIATVKGVEVILTDED